MRKVDICMKKLLSLTLALVMCLFSLSALAELGSDFTQDEISVKIPESVSLPKADLSDTARAGTSLDVVTNSNGVYSITTPSGMAIKFDPRGLTFMTLTQSYYASYDVYSLFKDTATVNSYIAGMAADSYHIIVWDVYDAFKLIALDTLGSDQLTKHVGNLAFLSTEDVNTVARTLASALGASDYELYKFNNNIWIQIGDTNLFTIVNSEYARVEYVPNGTSMTKADYSDFTDFMRSLKLY